MSRLLYDSSSLVKDSLVICFYPYLLDIRPSLSGHLFRNCRVLEVYDSYCLVLISSVYVKLLPYEYLFRDISDFDSSYLDLIRSNMDKVLLFYGGCLPSDLLDLL